MTIKITPAIATRLEELSLMRDESVETIAGRILAQGLFEDEALDLAFDEIDAQMLNAQPTSKTSGRQSAEEPRDVMRVHVQQHKRAVRWPDGQPFGRR